MRSLLYALSGLAIVGQSLATVAATTLVPSSTGPCTCTFYKYAIKTTTYTFNSIAYEPTTVSSFTASQKKKTSTSTTTTTIINTSVYTETISNTATITARVPSVTTESVCPDFTPPADFTPYASTCTCPASTSTVYTYTEAHTITKMSTQYTATVTLSGTSSPTKIVTETVQQSAFSYLYIYTLATATSTVTKYKKTKTTTLTPFATPTAFKLQVSEAGEDYGIGNYSGYMFENKWTYDSGTTETNEECLSYNGTSSEAGIFHFANETAISLGSGLCTVPYTYYGLDCSDNTYVQSTGPALECFIDCAGLLFCYYDNYYSQWVYTDNTYDCAELYSYAYNGITPLEVRVIPV